MFTTSWSISSVGTLNALCTVAKLQGRHSQYYPCDYPCDLDVLTPGNELCKFADDTYLSILATNVESRSTAILFLAVGTQEQFDAKPKEVDSNCFCEYKKEASSCCISTNA